MNRGKVVPPGLGRFGFVTQRWANIVGLSAAVLARGLFARFAIGICEVGEKVGGLCESLPSGAEPALTKIRWGYLVIAAGRGFLRLRSASPHSAQDDSEI